MNRPAPGSPASFVGGGLVRLPPICLFAFLVILVFPWPVRGMEVHPPLSEQSVIAPKASRSLLLEGCAVDGAMVAVGERGHVLVSKDEGRTWRQVEVPTRATLTGVFFHDRKHGWAVGHDQVVLRTTDGGEHWRVVHSDPADERPLFDVWFRDGMNGFAVGAYGLFLETTDGGETWVDRPLGEEDFHLNRLAPGGRDRLYLAAEAGMVYRSEDAGRTWESLPSPYQGSFFGALWLGGDTVLLYGLRGHLFRSDDGGETWAALDTGIEASLTDGVVLGDGTVVLVGLGGTVLVSHDEGRTFTLRPQADRKGVAAVVEAGDGVPVLFGEFGARRFEVGK